MVLRMARARYVLTLCLSLFLPATAFLSIPTLVGPWSSGAAHETARLDHLLHSTSSNNPETRSHRRRGAPGGGVLPCCRTARCGQQTASLLQVRDKHITLGLSPYLQIRLTVLCTHCLNLISKSCIVSMTIISTALREVCAFTYNLNLPSSA